MQIWGSVPCKTRGLPPIPKQKQQLCSDFNFFSISLQVSSLSQLSAGLHMAPTTAKQNTLIKPTRTLQPKSCSKVMNSGRGRVPTEFCLICRAGVTPYRKFIRHLYLKKKMLKYIKYPQCTEASARRAQPPETAKFIWEQLLTQELKSILSSPSKVLYFQRSPTLSFPLLIK